MSEEVSKALTWDWNGKMPIPVFLSGHGGLLLGTGKLEDTHFLVIYQASAPHEVGDTWENKDGERDEIIGAVEFTGPKALEAVQVWIDALEHLKGKMVE